jgi:glutaminase
VTEIDVAARRLLAALGAWMAESGRELVLVAPAHGDLLGDLPAAVARVFADLDAATEWCEEQLLAGHGEAPAAAARVALADQRLTRGLDAAMLARLEALLRPRSFSAGETIFAAGDPADAIFLLVEGEVTIELGFEAGKRRLATLTPGLAFGEVALADFPVRPASVHAETDGECLALTVEDFNRLGEEDPALQAALMRNLLASFYEVIGRMTREVGSLFEGR